MINIVYNLPDITFIGGERQNLLFPLIRESIDGKQEPFDAEYCTIDFSISHFSNNGGTPVLTKPATIIRDDDGIFSIANVILEPMETYELFGRYVYQITVISDLGYSDIPGHGIMNITRNIHPDYIRNNVKG